MSPSPGPIEPLPSESFPISWVRHWTKTRRNRLMGSTKMRGLLITGLRAWRSIAGENTALERTFRRSFNRVKKEEGPGWEQYAGQRFVYTKSTVRPGPTVAIYMKGSCDLTSMFAAAPIIRE